MILTQEHLERIASAMCKARKRPTDELVAGMKELAAIYHENDRRTIAADLVMIINDLEGK